MKTWTTFYNIPLHGPSFNKYPTKATKVPGLIPKDR